MSTVAIAFAVLESKVNATGLGLVFTANVVPQVLLLPLAGAIADRLGRRRVMLSADVLRCGAQGSLAVALAAGGPAVAVRAAGLARRDRDRVLLAGAERADGGDRAPRPARQRQRPVRAGRLGHQDRGPGAGRGSDRPGRAVRGGGRGRLQLPGQRAGPQPAPAAARRPRAKRRRGRPARGSRPGRVPGPVRRHGRGLGRVPVPDLAVGDHCAVRLLQPDHLGALDAARPGHGPGLPRRRRGLGCDHGRPGRGRDRGRAALPGPGGRSGRW